MQLALRKPDPLPNRDLMGEGVINPRSPRRLCQYPVAFGRQWLSRLHWANRLLFVLRRPLMVGIAVFGDLSSLEGSKCEPNKSVCTK